MQKLKYFTILFLLLGSYSCIDDTDLEQKGLDSRPAQQSVMEARDYFQEYAAHVELGEQPTGLYPGNFAPDWSKAVVTADPTTVCVNVPIVSDIAYEGTFVADYDSVRVASPEVYYTAVGQKMVIAKNRESGAFGCYIVTIVPDQKNATKSSTAAAKMYDNGDPATKFSGTAFFTTLGGNYYPVAAGRYRNGERYAATSLWWHTDGGMQKLSEDLMELMGGKNLYARKKTMSKDWEFQTAFESISSGGMYTDSWSHGVSSGSYNSGGVPVTPTNNNSNYNTDTYGGLKNNNKTNTTTGQTRVEQEYARLQQALANAQAQNASKEAIANYQQAITNFQIANNLDANNNPLNQGSTSYADYTGNNAAMAGYGTGSGTPTSKPATPESVAPNATKVFKPAAANSLTIDQWRNIEAMVKKIMADCMGGEMINSLKANKISLAYNPSLKWPQMNYSNLTNPVITINSLTDDCGLMHEMFHVSQLRTLSSKTAFNNISGNLEVEDKLATVLYMDRDLERLGGNATTWNVKYSARLNDRFYIQTLDLSGNLNSKGALNTWCSETVFNKEFYNFAKEIKKQYNGFLINETLSISKNLSILQKLSKNC